jgi:tripartite ATP-independent transporter DctM subunit
MIDISPELLTIVMFGGLLVLITTGYPMGLLLVGMGLGIGFLLMGPRVFEMFRLGSFKILSSFTFMAVPLFIFMGAMVEKSGLAEKLYDSLYIMLGGLRGGLAISVIFVGTILAACVGIIAASVISMGLIAYPAMIRRGYRKSFAAGCVCAGGTLGTLIPPSILLIAYGPTANISVGKLFMSSFVAGLIVSAMYTTYVFARAYLEKGIGPPIPPEERNVPLSAKLKMIPSSFLPPIGLVLAVMGSIFTGIATATEAAGVGAMASIIMAAGYRRLNWQLLKYSMDATVRNTCMVMLVALGALIFTTVFDYGGGADLVSTMILHAPGGRWGSLVIILFIVLVLGMFIDWIGIVFLVVPIATPIGAALGFDPLWFAMMIIVDLHTGYITPPFATAIFFLKGVIRPEWGGGITTREIIYGVLPYIGILCLSLVIFAIWPQILLWLPGLMIQPGAGG